MLHPGIRVSHAPCSDGMSSSDVRLSARYNCRLAPWYSADTCWLRRWSRSTSTSNNSITRSETTVDIRVYSDTSKLSTQKLRTMYNVLLRRCQSVILSVGSICCYFMTVLNDEFYMDVWMNDIFKEDCLRICAVKLWKITEISFRMATIRPVTYKTF